MYINYLLKSNTSWISYLLTYHGNTIKSTVNTVNMSGWEIL